ncbi:MAG TPA: FapA family protein [archaeon]|nr:FapA family protein [archaeon]
MNEEKQKTSDEGQKAAEEKQPEAVKDKKGVNIMFEVSKDKLEAYITLIPLTESPRFSTAEIKKELVEKKIIIGINKETLDLLDKEITYNKKLLIASGEKPKEGKDGSIVLFFKNKEPVKVKKGEKIGEIIPPEEGAEGINVFGEKILSRLMKKAKIPNRVNVEFSAENENLLIAKNDGYFSVDQSTLTVTPFFELEKSTNEYEAYVKVKKLLHEGDFKGEDLKRFLNDNGIVYGILDEEIENIFRQVRFEESVLTAQGVRVVNEKDGQIKYYFDTELKPLEDEYGKLDYKELNLIQNVKKGDKLAEYFPPEKGVEGCTIFGKKIPPKEGAHPPLPSGKNAQQDPKNPNLLIAEIDGSVRLKGKSVEVEPVVTIKKDVDFSTGNINFNGSVFINGDVKSGFSVKAKNDVQVNGVVEEAVIEAGGDVLLKTGFVGRSKGKIIAQGNVTAKFCENENIICEGDLYISEYVMHSTIQTKGTLFITEKTGLIVGGEIYAVKGIEAKTIGNQNYSPTAIIVGMDKETNDEIRELKEYLAENAKQLKKIETILEKFARRKLIKKALPDHIIKIIPELKLLKNLKEAKARNIMTKIKQLASIADKSRTAVVKIFNVVYPGTTITIYDRHFTVSEPMKYVYFKYTDQELVAADLEELE